MILTNRRHRLLYSALAGMIVASSLPLLYLLLSRIPSEVRAARFITPSQSPLSLFILLWAVMLVYMLLADLINDPRVVSPWRELLIVAIPVISTAFAVRLLVYPNLPTNAAHWLIELVGAVVQFTQGLRIELVLVLVNAYLWFRTALLTDNDLTFLQVGMSFRVALLLSVLSNIALTVVAHRSAELAIQLFLLYVGFGLLSVALARIDQMAVGVANSRGSLLPWNRLGQIIVVSVIYLLAVIAAGSLLTPSFLRTVLGLFAPLWIALRWLLVQIIYLTFLLLTPLLERVARLLEGILVDAEPQPVTAEAVPAGEYISFSDMVREVALVRYCLVTVIIAVVVGLLLLFFVRTVRRQRVGEDEDVQDERMTTGAGIALRGLDRLRAWLQLLRTYGISRQLLDAITVENMYANLLRLARQRGYPRPPATPPDLFLPHLALAFPDSPDSQERLREITVAYMRVYYGERTVSGEELESLRTIYRSIVEPATTTSDNESPNEVE